MTRTAALTRCPLVLAGKESTGAVYHGLYEHPLHRVYIEVDEMAQSSANYAFEGYEADWAVQHRRVFAYRAGKKHNEKSLNYLSMCQLHVQSHEVTDNLVGIPTKMRNGVLAYVRSLRMGICSCATSWPVPKS